MPMIDLTYPEGALDPAARTEAVRKLTSALLRIEGASDESENALGMCWTIVHELPEGGINVAGQLAALADLPEDEVSWMRQSRPAYRSQ